MAASGWSLRDLALARDQCWYRIPVRSMEKWLFRRWPPQWLAFRQTSTFGPGAFAVRYYAQVLEVRQVLRRKLFPDQPHDGEALQRYYQLVLGPLQQLEHPVLSRRRR